MILRYGCKLEFIDEDEIEDGGVSRRRRMGDRDGIPSMVRKRSKGVM